jgi:hypothetical protein
VSKYNQPSGDDKLQNNGPSRQLSGRLKCHSPPNTAMPYFVSLLKLHSSIEQMDVNYKSKVLSSLEKNEIDFASVSVSTNMNVERLIFAK